MLRTVLRVRGVVFTGAGSPFGEFVGAAGFEPTTSCL